MRPESRQPMSDNPADGARTAGRRPQRRGRSAAAHHWLPPQAGIVPRVRIGRRWVSVLWAIPIGAAALMVLIAVAQSLRELPGVQGLHRAVPRHRPGRAVGGIRLSVVAAGPAFPQHAIHAVHHPGRHADPRRSSTALLEAGLHAGDRLVPFPGPGAEGAGVDRQGRFRHLPDMARHSRPAPHPRASPAGGISRSTCSG